MTDSYIVFECLAEPAKNLIATAVVRAIKKAYPERKIVVVTFFPEVWLHNPSVYRVHKSDRLSYFYDMYVKDQDTLIFRHNPIMTDDFVHDRKHLAEIWCDLCGVPYDGNKPELYFTWREHEAVSKLVLSDKPIFMIEAHTSGNPSLVTHWPKDIPPDTAQKVVEIMNSKGFVSVEIRDNHHPKIPGTLQLNLDLRLKLCAIERSKVRLFSDSYSQHSAAALGLPSIVLWVTGNPKVSGHEMHDNVMHSAKNSVKDTIDGYKEGYDISGIANYYPPLFTNLFDAKAIAERLMK